MTQVALFFLALKSIKSLCSFVLRHFLSARLFSFLADLTSSLNHGTDGLFVTVLVIIGAWRSRATLSVLLYSLTKPSRSYECRFVQRSVRESSCSNTPLESPINSQAMCL